ncbi:hypothetical protein [Oceanithermus desulfurans]|uniref:Uncharacterized protein n=2 Tax=Oceanithermus desulfurans TaxID=227924 RepID=A0A511RMD2_9DEIN|nr:hypothetical protein [Oceanithermus desulfurans]MBB6030487.1 hypothetical protein [Oceanithermus desulfurans]GEM90102.1 hypothetical protein ODE01S_15360 [Oceanithermus desulfurans NBRC 100063]
MLQKTKYVLLGAFLSALGLWGLAVTIPNSFSSGEVVSASKMNENFQALKAAVDALEAKLSEVQAGQKALTSAAGVLAYARQDQGALVQSFNPAGNVTLEFDASNKYATFTFSGLDLSDAAILVTPGGLGLADQGLTCRVDHVLFDGSDSTVGVECVTVRDVTGTGDPRVDLSWEELYLVAIR